MAFSLNSPPTPAHIRGVLQILPVLVHDVLWEQLKLNFAVANQPMLAAGAVWEGGNAVAVLERCKANWELFGGWAGTPQTQSHLCSFVATQNSSF